MSKEAYDAFNRLARRFHDAAGAEGPATDEEAALMAAEYLNAVVEQLSDETLTTVLDEFRAGQLRMKNTATSVKQWLESDRGRRREREFKRFIAQLNSRMGDVAPAT